MTPLFRLTKHTQQERNVLVSNDFIPRNILLYSEEAIFHITSESIRKRSKTYNENESTTFFHLLLEHYYHIDNEMQWLKINVLYDELIGLKQQINILMNTQLQAFLIKSVPEGDQSDFAKLVQVFYHKGYGNLKSDNYFFDTIVPKLSHSCYPNCTLDFCEHICHIRSIRDIDKNHQLTVNYSDDLTYKSVIERRQLLMQNEGFFCTCERCNAFCDDTRQFNCFNDTDCNGKHFVQQSTHTSTFNLTKCTMCRKSAPALSCYNAQQWESNFNRFKHDLVNQFREASAVFQVTKEPSIMENVLNYPCHYNHSMSVSLTQELIPFSSDYFSLLELTKRFIQPYLNSAYFPNSESICAMFCASKCFYTVSQRLNNLGESNSDEQRKVRVESIYLAKRFACSAIRDCKLLHGREIVSSHQSDNTEMLLALLRLIDNETTSTTCCAFCEDSSHITTNVILKRCGKCRLVSYCGRACQEGHWKLHKNNCRVKL